MADVFVTTYKIIGDGQAKAEAFWAEYQRVRNTHVDFMEDQGALAFRTGFSGRVYSLFFDAEKTPPEGYRGTGDKQFLNETWLEEKRPRGNSKAGRNLQKLFAATERLPDAMDLASHFGWASPKIYPGSGNKVYFPNMCRVTLPEDITFLRLPRKADDGWSAPKGLLVAIPEDALMQSLHLHNISMKGADE